MEFNFPKTEGSGIAKLIPHASSEVQDIISKLLIYNPDNRISASLALKHPWFKEIRDQE
jgi:renal tumor antigen